LNSQLIVNWQQILTVTHLSLEKINLITIFHIFIKIILK